jgi:hypothetical protein
MKIMKKLNPINGSRAAASIYATDGFTRLGIIVVDPDDLGYISPVGNFKPQKGESHE